MTYTTSRSSYSTIEQWVAEAPNFFQLAQKRLRERQTKSGCFAHVSFFRPSKSSNVTQSIDSKLSPQQKQNLKFWISKCLDIEISTFYIEDVPNVCLGLKSAFQTATRTSSFSTVYFADSQLSRDSFHTPLLILLRPLILPNLISLFVEALTVVCLVVGLFVGRRGQYFGCATPVLQAANELFPCPRPFNWLPFAVDGGGCWAKHTCCV